MKKAFKITGIVIGSILLLLIILPFAFKGKIVERVKTEINRNLNAQVEFGTFGLSFIRSFPDVLVRVDELKVIGVEPFEKDTLAAIGRTGVTIDLFSLFRESGFEIKSISLDRPDILLKVLEDGTANWDIMKESEDDEITEGDAFVLHLKQARITGGNLIYHDDEITTYVLAEDVNGTLRGDLSLDVTTISTRNATIGAFSLHYEKMPILSKIAVDLTAEIEANLVDYIYTFRENEALFNELPVRFDGMIGLPEEGILMDFTFAALRSDFKDFLSIIPAVYSKNFSDLRADGSMELNGFVKGLYSDDEIPGFNIKLGVKDGMFQYPDLPASVSNVQLSLNVDNPGKDFDLTVIDMPQLRMNLGGNPIEARLNLRTPVSDPQIDALMKGRLDLSQIGDFYPLESGTSLRGVIDSDLQARGRMSSIESGRYGEFDASGHFNVSNMLYAANDLPQTVEVSRAEFFLSPQHLSMPVFDMKLGESDLTANGRIDNILGFLLDDQLLSGSFETRSSFFNLNQLMEETPEEKADEPMELSVIKVPENIDFSLRSRFDRLLFGQLDITNVEGLIRVAESRAALEDVRMYLLGGSLALNGSYSTLAELPAIDFGLDISQFDIQQAFNAFNTFQLLAPIGRYALGQFSANLSLSSLLDQTLSPLLETLTGNGNLRSSSISLQGSPAMTKLSDLTRVEAFRQFNIRDLMLAFEFSDGKMDVKPFDLRFGQSLAQVSGSTFFDQTIDFLMNIEMPRAQFGGAANQVLDNMVSQAAARGLNITPGETVNLDVIIKGTFTDPEVSFGLSGVVDDVAGQLRDQVEQRIQDEVDQVRDRVEDQVREGVDDARQKVQAELDARAAQVMEQANRQADNIRREANAGAERIRTEARQQAQRLENEASGPIAIAAARRAGEALIREADQRAKQVEDEGERNALRIISEAQLQADRIRSGEED
ncbi:MAG: AsmA family protein [Bacteroidales bacterium]|nr:AsmA family protein [Bacteroidales bacterium]